MVERWTSGLCFHSLLFACPSSDACGHDMVPILWDSKFEIFRARCGKPVYHELKYVLCGQV